MRRPFYYSLAGHGIFLLILILLGWLGPKLPARRQYVKTTPTVKVLSSVKSTPAPERRNTPKPTPKKTQTPKPTPKRTPTPRPTTPKPTVRQTPTLRKTMSVSKETVIPTPSPTPKNERPTPVPIKHDSAKKEMVKTPPPTPKPSPSPTPRKTPLETPEPIKTPKPDLKAPAPPTPGPRQTPPPMPTPDSVPPGGSRTQNTNTPSFNIADDNVNLPENYMLDAANRLQQHFFVPRSAQSSVKSCVISFRIKSDGTIYDIKIERSTEINGLDYLARRAVSETGSMLPISEYTDRSDIKATVRFVFGASD